METRSKKKINLELSDKKIRKNKRSASSTSFRRRERSQDNKRASSTSFKRRGRSQDVKKTDDAFHLSLERCCDVLYPIFLYETPSSETLMQWDDDSISFYRKMCTFYGVDHKNLESSLEEDEDKDEYVNYTPLMPPSPKEISHEEYEKLIIKPKSGCDWKILTTSFEFGAYFSEKPKSIPRPLYRLVKEAVDIMNNPTNDLTALTIVEEKIRLFCKYFHAHLPTGWKYDRDKTSTLVDDYDPKVTPRDFMANYTPIAINETIHFDEESGLSPLAMVLVMGIIYSRKMPLFSRMTPEMIAFYCKLCSCFGIDYQRVDAASWDNVCWMKTAERPPSVVFEPFITMDTRKISTKLSDKKIRNNKRSASWTSFKRRGRSLDVKKAGSNDDVFNVSWMRCCEIIDIVSSRKTPTYVEWDEYSQSFYRKMCTCFRVDYKNLKKTLEDDGSKLLKKCKPEQHMEFSGVYLPCRKDFTDDDEYVRQMKRVRWGIDRKILTPPFEFGAYLSGKPKSIPRPLYLLVKKAVNIMNNTDDDQTSLRIVEEKIRFFCKYFHAHLPTGWKYDRDKVNALVDDYDPAVKPRDLMAGYTPIPLYEAIHYDEETNLSPVEMAYVMGVIYSRKMPSIWGCGPRLMAFYCRLCSCFGIDYCCLEKASEDDVCLMKREEMPPLDFFFKP